LRSGTNSENLPAVLASPDTAKKVLLRMEMLQAGDSVRSVFSDTLQMKAGMFRWRVEKNDEK
jgi:hypothetical protein